MTGARTTAGAGTEPEPAATSAPTRVLVAVDDDSASHEAVEFAARWLPASAEVLVLNVVTGALAATFPTSFGAIASGAAVASAEERAQFDTASSLTESVAGELADGVEAVEATVVRGDAGSVICAIAEERSVDVIVVGTHDRSAWARFWFGSVSEHLARHAPCSVVIVR